MKSSKRTSEEAKAIKTARVQQAASKLIERFERGDLPAKLAPIFLTHADDIPCRRWSWSNQVLTALAGYDDARSYLDWQKAGRQVKKGERAFYIFEPIKRQITSTDETSGEESKRMICTGFTVGARFGYEQTEGEELPARARDREFIDALPLVNVARDWGLDVRTYNAERSNAAGWYGGSAIGLGVENLATWAHEMVHAADDRNGTLTKAPGQQPDNEIVAELGGATLLTLIGKPVDADLGGCFEYVKHYVDKIDGKLDRVCMKLIERIGRAVALILSTADALSESSDDDATQAA